MKRVRSLAAQIGDLLHRLSIVALELLVPVTSCACTSGGRVENIFRSKFSVRCSLFDVFLNSRNSDSNIEGNDRTHSPSNLVSSGGDSEPPSLPWFRTWRGVYVFVVGCFVLYVVLLTALSRAFS